ncbi:hypothetical protein [Nonomuraea sp. NPDC049625]|uniref:hypothetical protein n=1 Tax=Nonomuraea sp. NPDC049625 TaxID=3155775 RepID=UPI00343EC7F0
MFVGVLVTYVTFIVMLLPQGYDLWVALASATTTCLVAGHVTRTVVMISAAQGVVSVLPQRSFLGRILAFTLRAAMANPHEREDRQHELDNGES